MANETVGYIRCTMTHKISDVRKDKRGRFYYVGESGKITPSGQAGQNFIKENMRATREELEDVDVVQAVETVVETDTEDIKQDVVAVKHASVQHTERAEKKKSTGFWSLMRAIFLDDDEEKKTA